MFFKYFSFAWFKPLKYFPLEDNLCCRITLPKKLQSNCQSYLTWTWHLPSLPWWFCNYLFWNRIGLVSKLVNNLLRWSGLFSLNQKQVSLFTGNCFCTYYLIRPCVYLHSTYHFLAWSITDRLLHSMFHTSVVSFKQVNRKVHSFCWCFCSLLISSS